MTSVKTAMAAVVNDEQPIRQVTTAILRRHFFTLAGPFLVATFLFLVLIVPLIAPLIASQPDELVSGDGPSKAMTGLIFASIFVVFFVAPIIWTYARCVVMLMTTDILLGRPVRAARSYGFAWRHLFAACGASLWHSIISFAGYMLLIVPGIYLSIRYWFTLPVVLFAGAGALNAGAKSRDVVRGHYWSIFWGILAAVMGAILFVIVLAIVLGLALIGTGEEEGELLADLLGSLISCVLLFVFAVCGDVHRTAQYWHFVGSDEADDGSRRTRSPFDMLDEPEPEARPI